jgi:purine-nucleoside phosphorylase
MTVVMTELDKIREAVDYLRVKVSTQFKVGVVLGSGLGSFTDGIEVTAEIPYKEIPHFPVSTVEGHSGKLIFGKLGKVDLVVLSGRFHYYEGYTPAEVVFPIRVLKLLGVSQLFLSNAAGGVHPNFKVGDLMIIRDHISFAIQNPLLGKNMDEFGPRFPDMSEPYSKALVKKAHAIASTLGHTVREGIYYGVTGPTFETRAEYKMIHLMGGDAVGMSTVQEVIAATHCGMTVFAMSVITDLGIREEENIITHQEVLDAANIAAPKLTAIFKTMIETLDLASSN